MYLYCRGQKPETIGDHLAYYPCNSQFTYARVKVPNPCLRGTFDCLRLWFIKTYLKCTVRFNANNLWSFFLLVTLDSIYKAMDERLKASVNTCTNTRHHYYCVCLFINWCLLFWPSCFERSKLFWSWKIQFSVCHKSQLTVLCNSSFIQFQTAACWKRLCLYIRRSS